MTLEWMPVQGDSMWPSLRNGDAARLEPLAPGALVPGAVVVARMGGSFVIHRVLQVEQERVLLQGDNCLQADPAIPRSAILALVCDVRRGNAVLERGSWDVGPRRLGWLRVQLLRALRRWRVRRDVA